MRRIDDRLQRLEEKVTSLQVQSAGIDTKLNFALAIIGPVSLAILGGVITLLVNRKTETAKLRFVYPESELNRLLDLDDNDLLFLSCAASQNVLYYSSCYCAGQSRRDAKPLRPPRLHFQRQQNVNRIVQHGSDSIAQNGACAYSSPSNDLSA